MEELGLDSSVYFIICLFVAGFIQMIQYAADREWVKVAKILASGIAGGLVGWIMGVNILLTICAGFAASGLITVVKRVGDY